MRLVAAVGASLVAGLAATSWTALTLAEFGRFTAVLPIVAFPVAAVFAFRLLTRGRGPGKAPSVAAEDLLAVGIACATLLLTLPPDEQILGGFDPGVYVHTAAAVARSGSLLIDQPDLAALGAEERELLFRRLGKVYMPFQGMFLLADGRIAPQFYHLYPCLMAVAWSVGGLRAALLVNPLLNVAAILALYALASLLLGRRWALAAALLHALAAAQIRQAKFPTAELTTQLFLLAGAALLALATLEDDPPPLMAPLAGAALGMAALTRYDTVLFLVPLAVVLLWGMGPAGKTRPVLAALGTAAVFCAQSWLHQQFLSPYYKPVGGLVGGFLAAAALAIPALLLLRRTGAWRRLKVGGLRCETALRVSIAAALCMWVLFGWFVRPGLAGQGRIGLLFRRLVGDPPLSKLVALLSGPESGNMLYLVDLFGALGIVAALAGITALVVTRRRLWETGWLAASAAVLVILTMNIFHDHFLMWVSRRFVPVVVPLVSIGIAAAAALVARARQDRPPALAFVGVALVAAVIWLSADATRAMAREQEWPGLIGWCGSFAGVVPADAELYSDQSGFAAAMRFIHGRRAYELAAPNPERNSRLLTMMRRRAATGATVLFLTQRKIDDPRAAGLVPVGAYPFASSRLRESRRGVPTSRHPRGADFVLYRVQPSS